MSRGAQGSSSAGREPGWVGLPWGTAGEMERAVFPKPVFLTEPHAPGSLGPLWCSESTLSEEKMSMLQRPGNHISWTVGRGAGTGSLQSRVHRAGPEDRSSPTRTQLSPWVWVCGVNRRKTQKDIRVLRWLWEVGDLPVCGFSIPRNMLGRRRGVERINVLEVIFKRFIYFIYVYE